MNRLTRDGTSESVSRDQTIGRERGQGNIIFPCSVDHEQDYQPYSVDYNTLLYVTTIHTYSNITRYVNPLVILLWQESFRFLNEGFMSKGAAG